MMVAPMVAQLLAGSPVVASGPSSLVPKVARAFELSLASFESCELAAVAATQTATSTQARYLQLMETELAKLARSELSIWSLEL